MSLDPLQQALAAALVPGADIATALESVGELPLTAAAHARELIRAIDRLGAAHFAAEAPDGLLRLFLLFEQVETPEAGEILAGDGIDRLIEIFDRPNLHVDVRMLLLNIFAKYHSKAGAGRIIESARAGYQSGSSMWCVILGSLRQEQTVSVEICNALASPLPVNFIAVALLDLANRLAYRGRLHRHPFDSADGMIRLQTYLSDPDPARYSYALSAASALAYLTGQGREQLLTLAMEHPSAPVQMRGAWAAAKLGSETGARVLSRVCLDPRHSQVAWGYLEDLGRHELIPLEAQRPDFRALAEMCNWLSHPTQFGRPPDDVSIFDSREMDWTPTGDRRRLWLIRFCYESQTQGEAEQTGIGMVGAMTLCLTSPARSDAAPEDIYGLHCCWELRLKNDPRRPERASAQAGRALLGI